MYFPIQPKLTRSRAWLAAVEAVDRLPNYEAHNVVIDIAEPLAVSVEDARVESLVDTYLRQHGRMPLRSVANTIFPTALYRRHGAPEFYSVYTKKIFPRLRRANSDWGRYFDRLTQFQPAEGKMLNPLLDLVDKMKAQLASDRTYRNIYELNIYDPVRDAGRTQGRQCLSFLSFKLNSDHKVCLTAIYRNHYYTERLLGNLIGLSELIGFVAEEVGASVGSLTILSTHAEVDCPGTRSDLRELHQKCSTALMPEATIPDTLNSRQAVQQ